MKPVPPPPPKKKKKKKTKTKNKLAHVSYFLHFMRLYSIRLYFSQKYNLRV